MKRFADLFAAIDQTNSTNAKVEAMVDYFSTAPPADAAWAVFFLTGRRLKRLIHGASVADWVASATGFGNWMLGECYAVVGDGAETAALMLDQMPTIQTNAASLAEWVDDRILPLRTADPEDQQLHVIEWMRGLDRWQRFTLLKLLTGELRVGVSQTLVVRALAQAATLPVTTMAARLMGDWTPSASWFESLLAHGVTSDDLSRPYPFCLASPIDNDVVEATPLAALLGDVAQWQVEWKWDGIRAQIVKRAGQVHVWSRGEELITDRFPEVSDIASRLPDGTVLDGEILAVHRRAADAFRCASAAHRAAEAGRAQGTRHPGRVHGIRRARAQRHRRTPGAALAAAAMARVVDRGDPLGGCDAGRVTSTARSHTRHCFPSRMTPRRRARCRRCCARRRRSTRPPG